MPIYLDNSATTQVRTEVLEAMLPYLTDHWGNPSSIHGAGRRAAKAIKKSREQVAGLLNCLPEEIYFTSGGTMSNNIALLGRARFAEANGHGRHLITTAVEHPAVLGPSQFLESSGWKVTYLPVDKKGQVSFSDFERAMTAETSIVSVMWANNEIGTLQPVQEIADNVCAREIFMHTDAIQVAGKIPIDLSQLSISSLSLSGHKFYAPKGCGVIYLKRLANVMPIVFGGGQEMGVMPGTESLANIVAVGAAAELAKREEAENLLHLRRCQQIIADQLRQCERLMVTGPSSLEDRLPGHLSYCLPGVEGEALVLRADLKGVQISSGSACHKGIIEASQVLKAIGLSKEQAMGSVRISVGRFNDEEQCREAAQILLQVFAKVSGKAQAALTLT
ncbi:MAG: cysteine desulfurase family protein [Candidatus Obscuribacterales bacterium]|nr:cysteine desulfurase family protein [Candidatus Obscuribacterales bacterium]